MKKNKRTLSILVALLGVFGLTGCAEPISKSETDIITLTGPNGETISLKTDDIYHGELEDADSIKGFYDALYEVAVRYKMSGPEYAATMKTLEARAKNQVDGEKETAKKTAKDSGTRYEDEWQKILDANKAEDDKELQDIFTYREMAKEYKDEFYSTSKLANLLKEEDTGYLDTMVPYHVRHILVKTNGKNRDFTTDTIGKDEAIKLTSVIRQLADGKNTFGQVARENSEDNAGDDSSQAKYGDLGIMSKATGFVNEFKLGVYAYDLLYSDKHTAENPEEVLGLDGTDVLDQYGAINSLKDLGTIPYGAVLSLQANADVTENSKGGSVNDGESRYFPRNVIFNKYFNKHNISVITPNQLVAPTVGADGKVTDENFVGIEDATLSVGARWTTITDKSGNSIKALGDELGNPILVARAGTDGYQGIHFIIVERNPMDKAADTVANPKAATIEEYYTTLIPGDTGYPVTEDGEAKLTYVTALIGDRGEQMKRADVIKSAIKSYDPNIDYKMYEELFSDVKLVIKNETIKNKVNSYIQNVRDENTYNAQETFVNAWEEYILMLELQENERANPQRLLSETCALNFKNNSSSPAYTQEGGACYYVKK